MTNELKDVTGRRGENIVELCLTDYRTFAKPLFRAAFLGEKWPSIDFYVELDGVPGKSLYFLAQAKATTSALTATCLNISTKKRDIDRLLRIPGPTYLLGVHEPTRRVFVRSVHTGIPVKAITRIPLLYELTSMNLQTLHREVRDYWATTGYKPTSSVFA
jgi:hypothetical protein